MLRVLILYGLHFVRLVLAVLEAGLGPCGEEQVGLTVEQQHCSNARQGRGGGEGENGEAGSDRAGHERHQAL